MKCKEVEIEVKTNLTVDQRTAETCLKLLELYVNHTGSVLIGHMEEDGYISYRFKERW